jgi:hypothetical protein
MGAGGSERPRSQNLTAKELVLRTVSDANDLSEVKTGGTADHPYRALYRPDGSNVDVCRRRNVTEGMRLVIANSEGAEIAPGLGPSDTKLDVGERLN